MGVKYCCPYCGKINYFNCTGHEYDGYPISSRTDCDVCGEEYVLKVSFVPKVQTSKLNWVDQVLNQTGVANV